MVIKYAVAMPAMLANNSYPTKPGDVVSILDQNAEDKWGLCIEMCNTALVPDLELLNLVKEKYTWAGVPGDLVPPNFGPAGPNHLGDLVRPDHIT